ncbi:MAG: VCBS repeat-containing protein, partial [Planctomycetota bacterium]
MPLRQPIALAAALFAATATAQPSFEGFSDFTEYGLGGLVNSEIIRDLVTADFDRDGDLDLAWIRPAAPTFPATDGSVFIRLNPGDGQFDASTEIVINNIGVRPVALAVGDFDGNGSPDIVVGNNGDGVSSGGLGVLLNNGSGAFTRFGELQLAFRIEDVAAGDLDNDGLDEIVFVNSSDPFVDIYEVDAGVNPPLIENVVLLPGVAGATPSESVAVGYIDSDNFLDIAVAD